AWGGGVHRADRVFVPGDAPRTCRSVAVGQVRAAGQVAGIERSTGSNAHRVEVLHGGVGDRREADRERICYRSSDREGVTAGVVGDLLGFDLRPVDTCLPSGDGGFTAADLGAGGGVGQVLHGGVHRHSGIGGPGQGVGAGSTVVDRCRLVHTTGHAEIYEPDLLVAEQIGAAGKKHV